MKKRWITTSLFLVLIIIATATLWVNKIPFAYLIYGDQIVDYVLEKSYNKARVANCLLSSYANIWDIDNVIIRGGGGHSGAYDGTPDPYDDNFLTQTDYDDTKNPILLLAKKAISDHLKLSGISDKKAISVYIAPELYKTDKRILLERNSPRDIHVSIYLNRNAEGINSPQVTFELLFYRAKHKQHPEITKTVPIKIDMNDPERTNKEKIVKELKDRWNMFIPGTCIQPYEMNCF